MFVCVRLASECVCLTRVCAVSCVSRQTPRPERQQTHFKVVEGCAHPLEGRIYLPATKSWKCPGMLLWVSSTVSLGSGSEKPQVQPATENEET